MADVIATNTDRMQSDLNLLEEQIVKMDTAFQAAWDAVEALNATWEGPAHDTLVAQFLQDQETVKTMIISLRNYREELENEKKEYETCEQNVNSLVRSMDV